jgi:hypothetical protein
VLDHVADAWEAAFKLPPAPAFAPEEKETESVPDPEKRKPKTVKRPRPGRRR